VAGLLLLFGALGAGIGWAVTRAGGLHSATSAGGGVHVVVPGSSNGSASQALDVQAVASKVKPAVVDIDTVLDSGGRSGQAAGTGMLVTSGGDVLTNNHVIEGATSIQATVPGHGSHKATVVGVNPSADVAVIHVQGVSGLPTVTFGDSSALKLGQDVVAIGNALGRGGATVTSGSITGLDRSITVGGDSGTAEQLSGLIESDAPISPGDSGGPLANAQGQVIGMITAGSSRGFRQTTSTDGYAIPAGTANDIVHQVLAGQASSTVIIGEAGYVGVQVRDVDAATANRLGLSGRSGALVTGVVSGSPAEQAGITRGSVITSVDGADVSSSSALRPAIQTHKPGQRIQVTWVDQAGSHTATVTLVSGPAA
jgi:S1-C subfamily serine protease